MGVLDGLCMFLLFAPNVLTMGGAGRGERRRNRKRKNGIYVNMTNLLYSLHHTLDMFFFLLFLFFSGHVLKKKTNHPTSAQSNCCKSHTPGYMALFPAGKPEVVRDGFLVCPMHLFMVQHIIKQHFAGSELANRRALKRNNELRGS